MDPGKYEPWWQSLGESQRAEALGMAGAMPKWMIDSLGTASILTLDVELPDGTTGRLLSTRFRDFLEPKF